MGVGVDPLPYELRPDAVTPLHLVGVGERLSSKHTCVDPEAPDLIGEPAAAPGLEIGAVDLARQCLGLCRKVCRVDEPLCAHGLRQLGWPVVGVDEAVHVPSEPQSQRQVALGDARHGLTVEHPSQLPAVLPPSMM